MEPLVRRTLADPEAIPLIGVKGARDQVYSTAHVLATEAAIAAMLADQLQRSDYAVRKRFLAFGWERSSS